MLSFHNCLQCVGLIDLGCKPFILVFKKEASEIIKIGVNIEAMVSQFVVSKNKILLYIDSKLFHYLRSFLIQICIFLLVGLVAVWVK